jgi:tetratricopeptide (TPR) repeat protein
VIRGLCTFYIVRAQLATARELGEQCVRLGEQSKEPVHLIEGYTALGYALFYAGELDRAEDALQRSLQIYRSSDGQHLEYPTTQDPAISDLSLLALAAWMRGDNAGSLERSEDALAIARQLGRPFDMAYAHCFAAMLYNMRGEADLAAQRAADAIALAKRYGFDIWLAAGTLHAAIAQGSLGDDAAAELLEATLQLWRAAGAALNMPFFLAGLADIRRRNNQTKDALQALDQAIEHSVRHQECFYDVVLLRMRGELRLSVGNGETDPGKEDLVQALEIARAQGVRLLELDVLAALHLWCVRKGEPDPYLAELKTLHRSLAETVGDAVPAQRIAQLLGDGHSIN